MLVRLLGVSGAVVVGSMLLGSCGDGGGSTEKGKPDAGGGAGGDAASTPCSAGEFRCVGDALETCSADETHFQPVATCKAGLCDAEGKQCDNCVAGEGACEASGTSYKACDATGQKEQATTCSGAAPFCIDKAGKPACVACKVASDCPPSASECSVAACSAGGTCGVSPVAKGAPCGASGAGGACDGAGACVYCTPGEKRCTGLVPETCDAKGQWSAAAACSGADPICLAGACVQCVATTDCAVSTNECLSATCASNKCGYSPKAQGTACGSGAGTCNGSGQCNVCQPGTKTCNGNVPLVCGNNGQYAAQPACSGGTPECDPASGSCVQCTSLGQCPTSSNPCLSPSCTTGSCGFAPKAAGTTCPGGTCSATGVCQVCTPGTKTCSGNSVLTCNAQGQYDAPVACTGGTSLCDASTGTCVQCLDATTCTQPTNVCLQATCQLGTCGIANKSDGAACAVGADAGSCSGGVCKVCTTGATRCKPGTTNVRQTCGGNGQWQDSTCPSATPVCVAGICSAAAACGNNAVEAGEECDDGNTSNGDACNSQCKYPTGQTQVDAAPTCKAILSTGKSTGSAVYWVNPSMGPTTGAFQVYCDMSVAGGGWAVFLSGSQLSQVFTSAAVGTPGPGAYKLSDAQIGLLLGAATDTHNVRLECGTRVATIQLPAGWTSIGDITSCVGAVGGMCVSSNGHTYYTGLYASTDSGSEYLTSMLKPSMYGSGYPPCRVHNVGDFSARYLAR